MSTKVDTTWRDRYADKVEAAAAMLRVFHNAAAPSLENRLDDGTYEITTRFEEAARPIPAAEGPDQDRVATQSR